MPYKQKDTAWSRQMREYKKGHMDRLSESVRQNYPVALEQAGEILRHKSALKVTLEEMQLLESELPGRSPNTMLQKCCTIRHFLKWTGNKDAQKWEPRFRSVPKANRVWLTEEQIMVIREAAHSMGCLHELAFSLGVDNSLRGVDMSFLTLDQARNLLRYGQWNIRWKGGKEHPLCLSPMTYAPLTAYLEHRQKLVEEYEKDHPQLFVKWNPVRKAFLPMNPEQVRKVIEQLSAKVGIYFRTHDDRASFGHRHYYVAGTPLEEIADMMAHDSLNTTFKSYIGILSERRKLAQAKLCPSVISQYPRAR